MNNCLSHLKDAVKGVDFFAIPVQLTYKNQRNFNTVVGGFCTLMIILGILVTFPILLLQDMTSPSFKMVVPTWQKFLAYPNTYESSIPTSVANMAY